MNQNPINLKLLDLPTIFSIEDAKTNGISQQWLSRAVYKGHIYKIGVGVYAHPKTRLSPSELDFAAGCCIFGKQAVIGGLTALFHYGLVDAPPAKVWVLVPITKQSRQKRFRCIRTTLDLKSGVTKKKYYKITGVERSLLDALYFSKIIGVNTALSASRKAFHKGLTTPEKLFNLAEKMKLKKLILDYWDPLTLE